MYEVTTVVIDLETFEKDTTTTVRREDEMFSFMKPKTLYKTRTCYSYNDKGTFRNCTVTRIK